MRIALAKDGEKSELKATLGVRVMWNGDPIRCSQCGREIDLEKIEGFVPSISGGIMGDEYIESYYLCTHCDVYTIEVIHDRFLGEEDVSLRGPVSKSEAEAKIDLIRRCPEPGNKKCRCEAHRSYFGRWLD